MDLRTLFDEKTTRIWQEFVTRESLTQQQEDQFADYLRLLLEWSKKINLTAITVPTSVIRYHFQDSLQLGHEVDLSDQTLFDVGSGGGFPGIPLAIKYPHMRIVLIEVSNKKIDFLDTVIEALDLDNVEIYTKDWRTFLRTTDDEADYICARASLQPEELLRMFKPVSPYKTATLVYWAAKDWMPSDKVFSHISNDVMYSVGNKKRRLVFLKDVTE